MKEWAEIPVAAQVKRIRHALGGLLPQWGLGDAELKFIFHGENTTFRAHTRHGDFLVRVARHGYNTPHEAASELAWAEAVHRDTGLAQCPVRTRDGELVVKFDVEGNPGRHVCVMRWVHGRIVGRRYGLERVRQLGELIARLQAHSAAWRRPRGFKRRKWDMTGLFEMGDREDPNYLWKLLPAEHRREFEGVRKATARALKHMQRRSDTGLLHSDLHCWNVVDDGRKLVAIDFDDCGFAPWVHDIAVTTAMWRTKPLERYRALMEGYHRVREFPAHQLKCMSEMVAARYVGVCLWVTGRAQDNANFRKNIRKWQDSYLDLTRKVMERVYA